MKNKCPFCNASCTSVTDDKKINNTIYRCKNSACLVETVSIQNDIADFYDSDGMNKLKNRIVDDRQKNPNSSVIEVSINNDGNGYYSLNYVIHYE